MFHLDGRNKNYSFSHLPCSAYFDGNKATVLDVDRVYKRKEVFRSFIATIRRTCQFSGTPSVSVNFAGYTNVKPPQKKKNVRIENPIFAIYQQTFHYHFGKPYMFTNAFSKPYTVYSQQVVLSNYYSDAISKEFSQ